MSSSDKKDPNFNRYSNLFLKHCAELRTYCSDLTGTMGAQGDSGICLWNFDLIKRSFKNKVISIR